MKIKTWKERCELMLMTGQTNVIYPDHRIRAMQQEIDELRGALNLQQVEDEPEEVFYRPILNRVDPRNTRRKTKGAP